MRARTTRLFARADRNRRVAGGRGVSGVPFDPDAIRTLAAILTETGLTEIEIADKESRIRVARTPAAVAAPVSFHPGIAPAAPTSAEAAAAPSTAIPSGLEEEATHPGAVL